MIIRLMMKGVILGIALGIPGMLSAQVRSVDTLVSPVLAMQAAGRATNTPAPAEEGEAAAFENLHQQKKLLNYLKRLHVADDKQAYQSNKKFYYHLAGVFARLRLYPLAMKCFLKTIQADSAGLQDNYLNPNTFDDLMVSHQTGNLTAAKSKPISYQRIDSVFNDGKPAIGYAMLFHVKQPAPGKRKIFILNNTGHTFITLIKYNADSSYTSASFGFYPRKKQLLSATPIFPATPAVFKDDAAHGWDEVLGMLITRRKFEKILKLTGEFSTAAYNLNSRNCTDFGLQAAALAGIHIEHTKGSWPLGSGNNPAYTGQALLEGEMSADGDAMLKAVFINNTLKH